MNGFFDSFSIVNLASLSFYGDCVGATNAKGRQERWHPIGPELYTQFGSDFLCCYETFNHFTSFSLLPEEGGALETTHTPYHLRLHRLSPCPYLIRPCTNLLQILRFLLSSLRFLKLQSSNPCACRFRSSVM